MIEANRDVSNVIEFIELINELNSEQYMQSIPNSISEKLQRLLGNSNDNENHKDYFNAIVQSQSVGHSFDQKPKNTYEYGCYINQNALTKTIPYKFYYRGHYDIKYKLIPSVLRENNWKKEDYYYHEIMVRCPEHFQYSSHLDKLVKMQHYDCPTRLLDITSNPLVALFFACKNFNCNNCSTSKEGKVYVFPVKPTEVAYSDSDKVLMLSCLARFSDNDKVKLLKETHSSLSNGKYSQVKGGSRYSNEIVERFIHEIATELPSFKREIKPLDILKPQFVQPNKTNGRILKQDGAFVISGLSKDETEAENKLKAISPTEIIVKNKDSILRQLASLGVHEAALFPEVDKVADFLKA